MCEALWQAREQRLAQAQTDARRYGNDRTYLRAAIGVTLEQLKGEMKGDPIATLEDALRETEGSS